MWWNQLVMSQRSRRRKGTSSLFMVVAWYIWKEHNARVFDHRMATTPVILDRIRWRLRCG
jgi:hypothetical protein